MVPESLQMRHFLTSTHSDDAKISELQSQSSFKLQEASSSSNSKLKLGSMIGTFFILAMILLGCALVFVVHVSLGRSRMTRARPEARQEENLSPRHKQAWSG